MISRMPKHVANVAAPIHRTLVKPLSSAWVSLEFPPAKLSYQNMMQFTTTASVVVRRIDAMPRTTIPENTKAVVVVCDAKEDKCWTKSCQTWPDSPLGWRRPTRTKRTNTTDVQTPTHRNNFVCCLISTFDTAPQFKILYN